MIWEKKGKKAIQRKKEELEEQGKRRRWGSNRYPDMSMLPILYLIRRPCRLVVPSRGTVVVRA